MTDLDRLLDFAERSWVPEVLLDEALQVWQTRFWDEEAGLAVEEWDRTWTTGNDYRGVNADMHGVEATPTAADALAATDPAA